MADRRQAKPLDTILSIAEVARRTEEAVKSTGPSGNTSNVGAVRDKKPYNSKSTKSRGGQSSQGRVFDAINVKNHIKGDGEFVQPD